MRPFREKNFWRHHTILLGLLLVWNQACSPGASWETTILGGQQAYAKGEYAEAERIFQAAVIRAEKFGVKDLRYALSLNHLAQAFQAQGKYVEAEPLYLKTLDIVQTVQGAEHPDVAAVLNNLGVLHRMHGQYAEAEPFLTRALAIKEKALGSEHLDVALSLQNLATLYVTQTRYSLAQPLLKRAVKIREQALGPNHPDVAKTLNDYGDLLTKTGRQAEAEAVLARAAAIPTSQGASTPSL
jgi:tetratricopeptide (TPR) repeat protein